MDVSRRIAGVAGMDEVAGMLYAVAEGAELRPSGIGSAVITRVQSCGG